MSYEFGGAYGSLSYLNHSCTCGFVPQRHESASDVQFSCKCKTGTGAFNANVEKRLNDGFSLGILVRSPPEDTLRILKLVDMLVEMTRTTLELAITHTIQHGDMDLQDAAYKFCSKTMIPGLVRRNLRIGFRAMKNFRADIVSKISSNLTKNRPLVWSGSLLCDMVNLCSGTVVKYYEEILKSIPLDKFDTMELHHDKSVKYMIEYMYTKESTPRDLRKKNEVTSVCKLYLRALDDIFQNEVRHAEILANMSCGPLVCNVHKDVFVFSTTFAGRNVSSVITSCANIDMRSLIGNVFLRSVGLSCMPNGSVKHNDLTPQNVCVILGAEGDRIGLFGNTYEFRDINVKFVDCGFASSPYYKHTSGHDVQKRTIYPFCVIDDELDTINPGNYLEYVRKLYKPRFGRGYPKVHTATMGNMVGFKYNDFVCFCASILGHIRMRPSCVKKSSLDDEKSVWSALELALSPNFGGMDPAEATETMMDFLKIPHKKGVDGAQCDLDYNIKAVGLQLLKP